MWRDLPHPSTSFRWVKPAASLKPDARIPDGITRDSGFRWVKPAASLKRAQTGTTGVTPDPCFRWVKPAASLKPGTLASAKAAALRKFPLGKTGGLIEARRGSRWWSPPCRVSAG